MLIGAQVLASTVLAPMRGALTPHKDIYAALKPGEFAGTMLLGGFRGLACDLLWTRGPHPLLPRSERLQRIEQQLRRGAQQPRRDVGRVAFAIEAKEHQRRS